MFFGLPASGDQNAMVTVIESPKCAKVPLVPVKWACTFFIASTQSLECLRASSWDGILRSASAPRAMMMLPESSTAKVIEVTTFIRECVCRIFALDHHAVQLYCFAVNPA